MQAMAPDERALYAALDTPTFRSGIDGGRWRTVSIDWPIGVFAVSAAERPHSPSEFGLRIDLSGYPQQAPTGSLWDLERKDWLAAADRPKGELAAHVFRTDWEEGRATYAPWDRVALDGHPDWTRQHPEDAWHPGRDITFILSRVHEVLRADG